MHVIWITNSFMYAQTNSLALIIPINTAVSSAIVELWWHSFATHVYQPLCAFLASTFFIWSFFSSLLDLSVFYRIEIANVHFIVKSHSYFIPPLWSMRTKLQPSHCWISIGYIDTTLSTIHQIRERKKAQLVIIPKDNCIYFRLCIFNLK